MFFGKPSAGWFHILSLPIPMTPETNDPADSADPGANVSNPGSCSEHHPNYTAERNTKNPKSNRPILHGIGRFHFAASLPYVVISSEGNSLH